MFLALLCPLLTCLLNAPAAHATPAHPGRGASFSGPFDRYIQAPGSRIIRPIAVYKSEGGVTNPQGAIDGSGAHLGRDGFLSLAFEQNIGGRTHLSIRRGSKWDDSTELAISHSESSTYVSRVSDGTNDRIQYDLPALMPIRRSGNHSLEDAKLRGAFKYISFHLAHGDAELIIDDVWIEYRAMPHWQDPRAYSGYFYSSDSLLNRCWYAGAYTLQLCTIDPKEGGSIVDYNRDHAHAPYPLEPGHWFSNYTISNGSSIVTDGAKRDRMYYSGDASVAAPSVAVSTYDMVSIKNGLDVLFNMMYSNGALPYASPPMGFSGEFSDTYHLHTLLGVYFYYHFTADLEYLQQVWPRYLRALHHSTGKVDGSGLMEVTSGADWLRPGLSGHASEPNAILFQVLGTTIDLARVMNDNETIGLCGALRKGLKLAITKLWNEKRGLFFDNLEGRDNIFPQDGNVWAVISGIVEPHIQQRISQELEKRWGTFGAPAVEIADTISPFISSLELKAHVMAGRPQTALDLIRRQWGYMLDTGAGFTNSTFIEGFSTNGNLRYPAYTVDSRNSHAHGWSTGPTQILSEEILGIELTSPAGRTWRVVPRICDLDWVQGGYATILGKFEAKLDHKSLTVSAPNGTTGEVHIWGRRYKVKGGAPWIAVRFGDDVVQHSSAEGVFRVQVPIT